MVAPIKQTDIRAASHLLSTLVGDGLWWLSIETLVREPAVLSFKPAHGLFSSILNYKCRTQVSESIIKSALHTIVSDRDTSKSSMMRRGT